ncbi:MAG: phosphonoacetate hydrolase [Rhodospirillaceae bacterium]|nr:phosphonoacetate hydrolase [Rhodospirillaceae bacterium]
MTERSAISVNGRDYQWPTAPVVVICCDGSEPDYTEQAMNDGVMPNLTRIVGAGENLLCRSVVPSFTNPNNLSIVTGRPPSVHGISGNYLIDPDTGDEVMMNDPKFLRVPTIFQAFQEAGGKVVVLTAKDKLRLLLGKNLKFGKDGAIAFSSEKSDQCTYADNGIEDVCAMVGMAVPDVYSAELSEFVFAAGVKLMAAEKPDLMYLSTTDYIQHKHAPGSEGANAFYAMMDKYIGELDAAGAVIVLTADHGMNAKHLPDGNPDVIYLQDVLDGQLGAGRSRTILPITDPYVVHHGALGSYATVYLTDIADAADTLAQLNAMDGVQKAYNKADAAREFELPPECIGDIVVISEKHKVIGTTEAEHDLSGLNEPLRSHGGATEQNIPLIVNRKLNRENSDLDFDGLRNFDAFYVACNYSAWLTQAAE